MTSNQELRAEIFEALETHSVAYTSLELSDKNSLFDLYKDHYEVTALVTDASHPSLPNNAWIDMLDSMGKRFPVLVIGSKQSNNLSFTKGRAESITWLSKPSFEEIIDSLDMAGVLGLSHRILNRETVPIYNPMLAVHMLQQNGALSIISIHSDDFRKVALEYGADAYYKLQMCFQQMLYDIWGVPGSFRSRDILCRSASTSNIYYILLERSRSDGNVPPPGALEKLSDRLVSKLQNLMWSQLFKTSSEKLLPDCIQVIPKFSVGHASGLYNPCVESSEVVQSLLETGKNVAKIQYSRIIDRQRELMQVLIQSPHLLTANYQAVFNIQDISKEQILEVQQSKSIKAISHALFGFESLVRVNIEQVERLLDKDNPLYLEARYLRPDILFSIASAVKLSLELDQACLGLAAKHFNKLPGRLMANILPRNFYYINQLQHLISGVNEITFEVSESEAINNIDLLLSARKNLSSTKYTIAIDDFGKGHAGLDRIIKIKPEIIKLDRNLVHNIHADNPKKAFVSGLVNAANITNSTVLAEGVELVKDFTTLQHIGVDLIQGYLLHRPQAGKDIVDDIGEQSSSLDTVA